MKTSQLSSGLARSLLHANLLSPKQLSEAQALAQQEGKPLTSCLVEQQFLSSQMLAEFCVEHYGLPLFELNELALDILPPQYLNLDLIVRHHALPIALRNNVLYLAMADPTNVAALDDFSFRFGKATDCQLVEETKLAHWINLLQQDDATQLLDLEQLNPSELSEAAALDSASLLAEEGAHDDAPIVRYIHNMLQEAVRRDASDIHFEPYEKFYRVRFRIDGLLHDIASPPIELAHRFAARLKVMARLDIAERRLPQDGRIKLQLTPHKAIDMRVNSLPTQWGEKVVLRLLDNSAAKLDIYQLGLLAEQVSRYLAALHQAQGLILVTGPTGSGKTVSLYTGLSILNTISTNISTAEDPVEIIMPGINQVQVHPKAGLSFATVLRALLRQDPDIIMVGEIRDLETAEIAVKAAQTGHLVLSTLHTNSAADTLSRLSNMGLAPYNIASSVSLIIAQRLVRLLCSHCKKPEVLSNQQLLNLGFSKEQLQQELHLYQAVGCAQCNDGYLGRSGIYELLVMDATLATLIMDGADSLTLDKSAKAAGMMGLRQVALEKVRLGITSVAEANRVTG